MTINTVIQEINSDYEDEIDSIKSSNTYDTYEINGSRANWKDVLAVYSVKTTTDTTAPQQVATVDENTKDLLSKIFWDMDTITSSISTRTETREKEETDEKGNKTTVTEKVTITVLDINITSKTASEMAEEYGFTDEQKAYLNDLIDDKNNDLWNSLIFGLNLSGSNIDIGSLNFENETADEVQKKIVAVATNSEAYSISARSGYCQAWVSDVYQVATGKRPTAHCAICAGEKWGVSSDWSQIQVGAAVYAYASNPYGHVAIYIGNGTVIHNLMGTVTVQSLESFVEGFHAFSWGFEG